MKTFVSIITFGVMLFSLSTSASASPISHLKQVGQGEMDYLFWTLYQAQFFQESPNEDMVSADITSADKSQDLALKIEYYQSIDNQDLIDATIDQWQHLGYSEQQIHRWSAPLSDIWPNVEPGNTLTFVAGKNGVSTFYLEDEVIGTLSDPLFGGAFLSIWLSERTSHPDLRSQLLGLDQ